MAFHPAVYRLIWQYMPQLTGKKVLVPSSGDNHAVFALALWGAQVTSADISERQLAHAQAIADRLDLDICFVCDDTVHLSKIKDHSFDLVYTSNGVHSWIDDIQTMYNNISRVLRPAGFSLMFDVHPFNRPFTGEPWQPPKIIKPYQETMPHCHWRVQDLVNAMLSAGLSLREMQELQAADDASFWFSYQDLAKQDKEQLAQLHDWKHNPMAALPAWISIISQK